MKAPDLKSTLVAGLIGAGLMYLLINLNSTQPPAFTTTQALGYGFLLGAGVQAGVRFTGVS